MLSLGPPSSHQRTPGRIYISCSLIHPTLHRRGVLRQRYNLIRPPVALHCGFRDHLFRMSCTVSWLTCRDSRFQSNSFQRGMRFISLLLEPIAFKHIPCFGVRVFAKEQVSYAHSSKQSSTVLSSALLDLKLGHSSFWGRCQMVIRPDRSIPEARTHDTLPRVTITSPTRLMSAPTSVCGQTPLCPELRYYARTTSLPT